MKRRGDWVSRGMPFPRIIPHSDGAGVIDKIGSGVDDRRVGQRVWIYGAQSCRPFGTAAQLTTVPADLAVPLPDEVSDDVGACLGIPVSPHTAPCWPTVQSPDPDRPAIRATSDETPGGVSDAELEHGVVRRPGRPITGDGDAAGTAPSTAKRHRPIWISLLPGVLLVGVD